MADLYTIPVNRAFEALKSSSNGLSQKEAEKRLQSYGKNKIKEEHKISPFKLFLTQFNSFVIKILIGATIISFLVGEVIDAVVILAIVVFNAVFGFIQDYKAEKSIEALRKMTALKSVVMRDGKEKIIAAEDIVPGDVLVLEEGTKIPADARLIEAIQLDMQEASLTGESMPVSKRTNVLKGKLSLGDQKNMAFSSTIVTRGKGRAVVISTGMHTEIGKIAKMIQEAPKETTPMQKKLESLGKRLGIGTIIICFLIFLLTVFVKLDTLPLLQNVVDSFIIAVALAVAAIPEGLPAVVTISLALGVRRMVKKNALIRKMASVETLGSTNVICSDKTGTLTKNEMTVGKMYCGGKILDVTGVGYGPEGEFLHKNKKYSSKEMELLLRIGMLCNNAKVSKNENHWEVIGDPTEGALVVSARKANFVNLDKKYPRIDEIPFSSETKSMITVHKDGKKKVAYIKGAPDVILKQCAKIYENGKINKLTAAKKKKILKMNEEFANQALRVLGFAYKPVKGKDYQKNLIFVGLQGMIDPAREEVKESIKTCREAGIRVVMITGDHKATAMAIAKQLGIKGNAITGSDLDSMSDKKFKNNVEKISIYARVNPEHKIRIVEALKEKGHVVAMTGDGVNDAPALKRSDIGISMGITGTDVAKEASEMVLTDDNFASIVNAVEEGRGIYDNIKKFINYLLSCNFGEILIILTASLFGMPLPLTAIQILWLNLVSDGLPAIALGVDPIQKGVMKKKPRDPKAHIIDKSMVFSIITVGILIAIGTLYLFKMNINNLLKAQTMAFCAMVAFEIVRLQIIRSSYNQSFFSNKWLIMAVMSSICLQLVVIYTPLNVFFKTVPLSLVDWGYIAIAAISLIVLNRGADAIYRIVKGTREQSK